MTQASSISASPVTRSPARKARLLEQPLFIVGVALVLRLLWLGMKPAHFDEGVNGWFIDQMTRTGLYRYDPANYHGPFHFYILYFAQTLLGRTEWALRLPLVLANVATVWMILQYHRFVPRRVTVWAAWAMAVSPGMLFYSRYAIHEAWMVLGMVTAFWGVAELWKYRTRNGLWAASMGATLMVLTKETYIMHLVAFGLACGTLKLLETVSPSQPATRAPARQWGWNDLAAALATGAAALIFFYSGGFLDFSILSGMVETYARWIHTGVSGESGHDKPWHYWLELTAQFEWPALAGMAFSLWALSPGMNRLLRLLAIYGGGVFVAYSLVSYKTPWCIISILWPFFFLFGAAAEAFRRPAVRWGAAALLAAGFWQAADLNYRRPTDPDHPYVYVQTYPDVALLTEPLKALRRIDPTSLHMSGHIILSSYHPLPWLLGEYTAVGYYDEEDHYPSRMDAGFLVVEESRVDRVEAALRESYFVIPFRLRSGMDDARIYLNAQRFAPVFPGREPEFEEKQ